MRTPQKKWVALLLLWGVIIVFQAIWLYEPSRMTTAEAEQLQAQVTRGARLYAQNCVICHGSEGQGIVGPPVNRPEWREDLTEIEREQVSTMLHEVISRGRGGTDTARWEFREENGERVITSFTRMPAWSQSVGGPLNEQQIQDLVSFLMHYAWGDAPTNLVDRDIPGPQLTKIVRQEATDPETGEPITVEEEVAITYEDLPEAQGVSQRVNDAAREALVTRGCLACHTLGDYGGWVGPNLTNVGDWTDPEFLAEFLEDPQATAPRMPTVWMGDGERKTVPEDIPVDWEGIHQSRMPNPANLGLTEEERALVVEYLSHLTTE